MKTTTLVFYDIGISMAFGGPLGLQKDIGTCDGYGYMKDESDYSVQPLLMSK